MRKQEFRSLFEASKLTHKNFGMLMGIGHSTLHRYLNGKDNVSVMALNAARWVCHVLGLRIVVDHLQCPEPQQRLRRPRRSP